MQTIFYVVGSAVLVAVAWFAFKVYLGLFLPLEKSAYAYLQQTLKKMDIVDHITPSCIRECAEVSANDARRSARLSRNTANMRAEMVSQLNLYADMLHVWIRSNEPFAKPEFEHFKTLFEKHNVQRLNK